MKAHTEKLTLVLMNCPNYLFAQLLCELAVLLVDYLWEEQYLVDFVQFYGEVAIFTIHREWEEQKMETHTLSSL
jgi:hypothetical protein